MEDELFYKKVRRAKRIIVLSVAALLILLAAACLFLGVSNLRQTTVIQELQGQMDQIHLMLEVNAEEAAQPTPAPASSLAYQDLFPELSAESRELAAPADKTIYLTFDDGPSALTPELLDVLEAEGVKATFFVVGDQIDRYPETLQDIAARGHTIGVHSDSHDYRRIYQSVEAFLADLSGAAAKVEETTGRQVQLLRLPGGSINGYDQAIWEELLAELLRRGYVYHDWNVSAQDAVSTSVPAASIVETVQRQVAGHDYSVVLMHDAVGRRSTVEALKELIPLLKEQGYTFAALDAGVKPVIFAYPTMQ